jgi:hypothetical protein
MVRFLALVLAATPPWASLEASQRTRAMVELKAEPWPGRLARAAAPFLGTPYAVSPLGEGEGHDPDPRLRLDAVDCVTLVEQALALATAADDGALIETLDRVRYTGSPSYGHRNHVMEAQWLPHLLQLGWLTNVTRAYGGKTTQKVKKVITPVTWEGKLGRSLGLEAGDQARGAFELDVIPAAHAVSALAHAPDGLVLVVVRSDLPSMVTRISHVAVQVQGPSGPMLRHASSAQHLVVDQLLADFLAAGRQATWPLVGLAVYEPQEPRRPGPER